MRDENPMRTFLVGRSKKADIVITDADHSVSGIHLELTEDAEGRYYIIDCNSTNGTFRKRGGRWDPIKQAYIGLDDRLLLGKYPSSIRKLLAMRVEKKTATPSPQKKGIYLGVERDPETGEIIPRRY